MNSKTKALQKSNNLLDRKISPENRSVFTDMICYIRSADISDYHQELVRYDLTEMILSAQDRGENIHNVIGRDYKEFCDEVIEHLPQRTTRQKIYSGLNVFFHCMAILGVINLFFSKDLYRIIREILSGQPSNYEIGISLSVIVFAGIIFIFSVVIVNVIAKTALNRTTNSGETKPSMMLIAAAVGVIALFIIITKIGKTIVFSINIFLFIILLAIFFAIHKILGTV